MSFVLGQVYLFAGKFAPKNWAICAGQTLSIKDNHGLYSILGTNYGGDGVTTFKLPDLRGHVPIHKNTPSEMGTNPNNLSLINLGEKGGRAPIVLSVSNLPAHDHNPMEPRLKITNALADELNPAGGSLAIGVENMYFEGTIDNDMYFNRNAITVKTEHTGSGTPFDNRQPALGMNYIICVVGEKPVQ